MENEKVSEWPRQINKSYQNNSPNRGRRRGVIMMLMYKLFCVNLCIVFTCPYYSRYELKVASPAWMSKCKGAESGRGGGVIRKMMAKYVVILQNTLQNIL